MPKLGSELYSPDEKNSAPVRLGQRIFLDRIALVAPEVLGSLRESVLPLFAALWESAAGNESARSWYRSWKSLSTWAVVADAHSEKAAATLGINPGLLHDVFVALSAWGRDVAHVEESWFMDDALLTLRSWTMAPESVETPGWKVLGRSYWVANGPAFELMWDPTAETWETFSAIAAAKLDEYRSEVEAWARERGFEPSPEKKAPRRTGDPGMHFEWLVRYQVQGWTHRQIAERYNRSYDPAKRTAPAVSTALTDTADLIRITLRQ